MSGSTSETQKCVICGDRAHGNHYGVLTCFGCRGFFQRTVRLDLSYVCRFRGNCLIDKKKRNQCRHCRFKRCISVGMKKEAVQEERDKIMFTYKNNKNNPPSSSSNGTGPKENGASSPAGASGSGSGSSTSSSSSSNPSLSPTSTSTISILLQAEKIARIIANTIEACGEELATAAVNKKVATFQDVHDAMNMDFHLVVEWAKHVPPFCELDLNDQVSLLRARAGELMLLEAARRSLAVAHDNFLLLANGSVVHRHGPDSNVVRCRMIDELIKPFHRISIEDSEFVCLKSVVLFDPNSEGLSDPERVRKLRNEMQQVFEEYERVKEQQGGYRLSEMLLTLPSLYSIRQQLVEKVKHVKVNKMAKLDKVLEEVLLGECDYNEQEWNHRNPNGSNIFFTSSTPNSSPLYPQQLSPETEETSKIFEDMVLDGRRTTTTKGSSSWIPQSSSPFTPLTPPPTTTTTSAPLLGVKKEEQVAAATNNAISNVILLTYPTPYLYMQSPENNNSNSNPPSSPTGMT